MHDTKKIRSASRWRRSVACVSLAVAALATSVPTAGAFKPFTHAQTGDAVLLDVGEDGAVTIAGKSYPVRQEVVDALVDWPDFYNAGVIGPDGFPDLTFGQSVIHPEDTGLWLRHIFDRAWAAQDDDSYSPEHRSQILAFAYGYLMHAAGDTWAHTLVNDFAEGTFPGVGEILTDTDKAAIALRHIIVEGYIGDATPGYDGNPERGPAPGGDVSDDSSLGVDFPTADEFVGVNRFIYETLVDPAAGTPSAERGPVIGFFLDLRGNLATAVTDWDPDPIDTLVGAWSDAKSRYDNIQPKVDALNAAVAKFNDCEILDFTCTKAGILATEIIPAAADLGFTVTMDTIGAIGDLIAGAVNAARDAVLTAVDALYDAYLVAWIEDIDAGLQGWAELGRASTVALFDPQARRDLQNEECAAEGGEQDQNRINCEDGISALDVLFDEVDPFINQHLLSMLGAPDFVGGLRQALQDLADDLDALLEPLGIAFNPLEELNAQIKELAKELIKDFVEEAYGIDVDTLHSLLTEPTSWLDVQEITIDFPILGQHTIAELFQPDDHERLDSYLGFEGTDHLEPTDPPHPDFPYQGVKLKDDAEFQDGDVAAFENAKTLGKLLLLDGPTLDQVMSDLMGRPYAFYAGQPNANIMLTPLPGVPGSSADMWLSSIDADHAWRADGQPVYPAGAPSGGQGSFPLWESCALRDDVFRTLFEDWENGDAQFPELGDAASMDANDPEAPESTLLVSGTTHSADGTTYLGGDATLEVVASDDFWKPEEISVSATITDAAGASSTQTFADGNFIDLDALPDGPVSIELQASDACRTEVAHTETYVVDTTAPAITVTSPVPNGRVFDTDDLSSIGWTSDDGPNGSGVDTESVTFDGATASQGQVLDMFLLNPGTHTIVVTAADNLGNTGSVTQAFVVRATSASLAANVQRAYDLGLITKADVRRSLAEKTATAVKAHQKGQHLTEHNALDAFISAIEAQLGKGIDPTTGRRFIAYARDLIATGG